jgi:thiamine-phosphate pyrophosphorylase
MVISDEQPELVKRVARALDGCTGIRVAVQLRRKHVEAAQLLELAEQLRALTHERGALLFINERVDVAVTVRADGVHLPQRALPVPRVRELFPENAWVGRSCHSAEELRAAEREGADYAVLSPVHAVPGKGRALGIDNFGALTNETKLPIVALGGLSPADIAPLWARGARGFAVIRGVLSDLDPRRASAHFAASLRALGEPTD